MGKKNKDNKDKFKANPFDYMGGGRIRELGDRYGVDHRDYNINMGRTSGSGRSYKGDRDDYDEAVRKAAMSDYDTRRTMEAQAMSGNKDAKKFAKKGFKNIGKVYEGNELMRKLHKDEGNGGSFSSASDFAGLTYKSVKADRNAQTAAYDETYAKTTDLNALKDKLMAEATEKAAGGGADPVEPSDRMAAVEDRLERAAGGGNTPPSLFDKDNAQPAKADDQADAARNFLEDYTADVREGANIRSDINAGVSNAARHVRDTYGR